ncbi:hypothetical protein DCS_01719 [Drechmeria coniospora]|uniref:Uncharacterized protein n=1 Tax=Drechmeria coniospora TaxID=98403 RepID=A0A151GU91_DRECN|nr:hypothetical protein DCS_01719 [Drechmeria coniospora]KYK60582.1 hypothetical protein DCS_01719 [Drechmeria coniospora]
MGSDCDGGAENMRHQTSPDSKRPGDKGQPLVGLVRMMKGASVGDSTQAAFRSPRANTSDSRSGHFESSIVAPNAPLLAKRWPLSVPRPSKSQLLRREHFHGVKPTGGESGFRTPKLIICLVCGTLRNPDRTIHNRLCRCFCNQQEGEEADDIFVDMEMGGLLKEVLDEELRGDLEWHTREELEADAEEEKEKASLRAMFPLLYARLAIRSREHTKEPRARGLQ